MQWRAYRQAIGRCALSGPPYALRSGAASRRVVSCGKHVVFARHEPGEEVEEVEEEKVEVEDEEMEEEEEVVGGEEQLAEL